MFHTTVAKDAGERKVIVRNRLFIAIDISDAVRSAMEVYVRALKEIRASAIRWERIEKLHLTLKFLGDTDAGKIPAIVSALARTAKAHEAFDLIIERTGVFPTPQKARVLWIGVRPNETLSKLHGDIETQLVPLKVAKETRRFDPHLTIARIRDSRQARPAIDMHASNEFGAMKCRVSDLKLYESKLLPGGSVYSVLKRFPLQEKS